MDLGDAINGARPLDAEIGGGVSGRGGAKRSNGAGDEEAHGVVQSQV